MINALKNTEKSLDMNFLNEFNHLYRLLLINLLYDKQQFNSALTEYLTAKIYIDYARGKKIIKERL